MLDTDTTAATKSHGDLLAAEVAVVRAAIRAGRYRGQTAGLAAGRLQANLVVLPVAFAGDFWRFCLLNPKPCPVVGVSAAVGVAGLVGLGEVDVRTDLPAYYVYREGRLAESLTDVSTVWRDDFVAFALGCSFTFEAALVAAGVELWHIRHDRVVPMFRSSIATHRAGRFGGGLVVSMRVVADADVALVTAVAGGYAHAHGEPVHVGDPAAIGIADITRPDWGDAWGDGAALPAGFTPMFWACGVTPQVAIVDARVAVCITHKPGHMLITDLDGECAPPVVKRPGFLDDV